MKPIPGERPEGSKRRLRQTVFFLTGFMLLLAPLLLLGRRAETDIPAEPLEVVRRYLTAVHARDFRAAYGFVSASDRRSWDEAGYLRGNPPLSGFALAAARKIAGDIEVRSLEHTVGGSRAHYLVGFRLPAGDELESLFFGWDAARLNALDPVEQARLSADLERLRRSGKMIPIEGREQFDLVREDGRWKIDFGWHSGIRVALAANLRRAGGLEVRFDRPELMASENEPFQADLRLSNRAAREIIATIEHRIVPHGLGGRIALIACGFLQPLTLAPGEVRQLSSAYLLDSGFPRGTPLQIVYEFRIEADMTAARRRMEDSGAALGAPLSAPAP